MEPSFNNWTTLFLLAAGQGLFLIAILIQANTRRKNFNWPIVILLSFFSLTLINYVLYWSGYNQRFPYLRFIPEIGFYLFGPMLYLYLKKVLFHEKVSRWYLLSFAPSFYILTLGLLYWISGAIPFNLEEMPVLGRLFRLPLWAWVIVTHMIVYNVLLYFNISRYQKDKNDEIAAIRVRWSKALTLFFTAFILAFASYYFLVQFDFFKIEWDYMISIVMSLAIYGIGYMAFTQPRIFNGIFLHQVFVPKKYKSSQLTESMGNELFMQIETYFLQQEPYLNPELRQANVCESLGCTTHHISQVINEKTGGSFNAYIKKHRLNYAEKILKANPDADIKTVCYQSGFNNKTTFNSAFKGQFNCTPTEYKNNLQSGS